MVLETAQERVKLLKAGQTGRQIESRYIRENGFKIIMKETETVVREHVESMKIPESTGRDILDAAVVVEGYLKNQAEIARINTEADAAETGVKAQITAQEKERLK